MNNFMPHGHCFYWNDWILISEVIGNSLIALAYFIIPLVLTRIARRRPDMTPEVKGFFILFSLFIGFCGLSHLIKIFNIWNAEYLLEATVDFLTGLISITTAVYVIIAHNIFNWVPKKEVYEQLVKDSEELRRLKKQETAEKYVQALKAFDDKLNEKE